MASRQSKNMTDSRALIGSDCFSEIDLSFTSIRHQAAQNVKIWDQIWKFDEKIKSLNRKLLITQNFASWKVFLSLIVIIHRSLEVFADTTTQFQFTEYFHATLTFSFFLQVSILADNAHWKDAN